MGEEETGGDRGGDRGESGGERERTGRKARGSSRAGTPLSAVSAPVERQILVNLVLDF